MKKLLVNSVNRFLEIKKIDSTNMFLLFLFFILMGIYAWIENGGGRIEVSFAAGIAGMFARSVFLLYYFFGTFSNARFCIITIIFIIGILYNMFLLVA